MAPIAYNELLIKLRGNNDEAYRALYNSVFPTVKRYIIQNSGTAQDAEDNFQESIIVLFTKLDDPDFALTSSLKTYLFAISRNLWLKKLRALKSHTDLDAEAFGDSLADTDGSTFELIPEPSVEDKVNNWLTKISKYCKIIVKAIFFQQEPMDKLMVKMGWKNRHTADNQKYKCLQQVKKEAIKDFR